MSLGFSTDGNCDWVVPKIEQKFLQTLRRPIPWTRSTGDIGKNRRSPSIITYTVELTAYSCDFLSLQVCLHTQLTTINCTNLYRRLSFL
jgi:hypothetical protein